MCKKLVCLLFFLLASGVAAGAGAWDRVAWYDSRYPTNWCDAASAANVRDGVAAAGYPILDSDQLKTWMDAHILDGELSVVIFCMDIPPDTVAETMSATCTLRQYLNAGGKIVFPADIPFYNVGHVDGSTTNWANAGATAILGFPTASAPRDSFNIVTFTPAGIDWGLTATWASQRPAAADVIAAQNLTVLATDNAGNAAAWAKHYVTGDNYRGFVYMYDTTGQPNVGDLMRLAEYLPTSAGSPIPADGSNIGPEIWEENVYIVLDYAPGLDAITHTAYFSDVKQDVIDRDAAHSLGSVPPWPSPTAFVVGYDDPGVPEYARAPLVGGTTYYWCIDEFDGTDTWFGAVWSFTVMPEQAWGPSPYDGEVVFSDGAFVWKLGDLDPTGLKLSYNIYIGTDQAAVAGIATGDTASPLYAGNVPAESYDYAGLDPETEHFWRVDTKLALTRPPFTFTITEGDVWSFTTLKVVPVTNPDLVGHYKLDGEVPGFAFDYSGYANHGTLQSDPQYVTGHEDGGLDLDGANDFVDFGAAPTFPVGLSDRSMCAWAKTDSVVGGWSWIAAYGNAGTSQAMFIGRNADDLFGGGYGDDIRFDDFWEIDTWRHICLTYDGTTAKLYADGTEVASEQKTWNIVISRAHLGRQVNDAVEFWDGVLDEVRIYSKVLSVKEIKILAGRLNASDPDPANGATDVPRTPILGWTPGAFAAAANGSRVYYGTDLAAVINRTAANEIVTIPSLPVTMPLGLGETFYWAVDTVNGAETWPGDVWSFTTTNWISVDDMESYTPWTTTGNDIFVSWRDGEGDCSDGNGNQTGSTLTENASPVLGGVQSMKYDFDNDGLVYSPCSLDQKSRLYLYSKIEAQVATLPSEIGTDWTVEGVEALSLPFHGQTGNATTESLWVQLQDGSKGYGDKVFYGDYEGEDLSDFNEASWHDWNIDLDDFNVDLENVVSIVIGIGTEGSAIPGGSGTLFFDEMRLYTPRCVPSRASGAFSKVDYSGPAGVPDCVVDYHELEVMTRDWLAETDFTASPLIARWQLDGNYDDSSGNGNDGTPVGAGLAFVTDPIRGQVLTLPGGSDIYVDCGSVGISGADQRTIACWAKADSTTIPDWTLIFGFTGNDDASGGNGSHFNIGSLGGPGGIGAHCWGWEETIFSDEEGLEWRHYAMTYDGTTIEYYGDGVLMDTDVAKSNVRALTHADRVHIGSRITQTSSFPGSVDDACIFDRVLTGAEIVTVMTGGAGTFAPEYHPVTSPANITDPEAVHNLKVNFRDYAELLNNWLATEGWPN